MISIIVPGPQVSTNQGYRKRGNGFGMYLTAEGQDYKFRIALAAKRAWRGKKMIDKPCKVSVIYYRPSLRGDVDGPGKFVLDSLEGIVFKNDSVVEEFCQVKGLDRENPRTEIMIEDWVLPF